MCLCIILPIGMVSWWGRSVRIVNWEAKSADFIIDDGKSSFFMIRTLDVYSKGADVRLRYALKSHDGDQVWTVAVLECLRSNQRTMWTETPLC